MKVNLILFELDELDVILGMDFLTKYHAMLGCSNKKIVLTEPGKFESKAIGDKKVKLTSMISVLKAIKLVKKGHTSYLAHVVDIEATRNDSRSVPIVCEYLEVCFRKK